MMCGIPNIVPRYSALGEWANGGVEYTEISNIPYFTNKGINTMAGTPTLESTVAALNKLYYDKDYRLALGKKGFDLISQPKFDWKNIAVEFEKVFASINTSVDDD